MYENKKMIAIPMAIVTSISEYELSVSNKSKSAKRVEMKSEATSPQAMKTILE